jgi:hypothetical protein
MSKMEVTPLARPLLETICVIKDDNDVSIYGNPHVATLVYYMFPAIPTRVVYD